MSRATPPVPVLSQLGRVIDHAVGYVFALAMHGRGYVVRAFVPDSLLEESGFEPLVPLSAEPVSEH
jgi:hypothetical protein